MVCWKSAGCVTTCLLLGIFFPPSGLTQGGEASPASAPGRNAIQNPGFESGKRAWQFWSEDDTTKTVFEIDQTVSHQGRASGRIAATDLTDNGCVYTYFPVIAGKKYNVSLWYKLKGVIPDSALISMNLNFNRQNGANGSAGHEVIRFPAGEKDTGWKRLEGEFVVPAGAALVQLVIAADRLAGTLWLDDFEVVAEKTAEENLSTPIPNGVFPDSRWDGVEPATGFVRTTRGLDPAAKQTRVYLTCDATNVYIRFRCEEPALSGLKAAVADRDGEVWADDCVEVFLCPHEITYHFIINSQNAVYDETLTGSDMSAKGFVQDASYNARILSQTRNGKDHWQVDIAIPFSELGGAPVDGDAWRVNFARSETQTREHSSYSPLAGIFYQLPRFSRLTFRNGKLMLTRSEKELGNPYRISRERPLFKELLLPVPGDYKVGNFSSDFYGLNLKLGKKQITPEVWASSVTAMMEEMGQAGMMGPTLTSMTSWQCVGGTTNKQFWSSQEACRAYYDKYGMARGYVLGTAAAVRQALAKGAEISDKKAHAANRLERAIQVIDPIYNAVLLNDLKKAAETYKHEPYFDHIFGNDEPIIQAISGPRDAMSVRMKQWDQEVIGKYGFGKYGIPAPDDPAYHGHKETHPFQWIAFNRWMSDKYVESRKQMRDVLKAIAPNIKFIPCNFWTMRAFVPYEFNKMADCGDEIMCDPYPGSGETRTGRGLFTVGFTTKLIHDLTGLPTWCYIQAWDYDNCSPEPDDIRAWVSEALKVGTSRIILYEEDFPRQTKPERYDAILKVSAFVRKMNKVNVPKDPDTAIFYSSASHGAEGACSRGDEVYTAYSLIGEKAGSWFDFVSDAQLSAGKKRLADYRMVYIPLATYQERPVVKLIEDYILQGGQVVIGDPTAFSWDVNGEDLSADRERMLGVRWGDTIQPRELYLTEAVFGCDKNDVFRVFPNYIPLEQKAPCYNYRRSFETRKIISVDKSVTVLGRFKTGEPAVLERPYGKGKIIYFSANPFIPDAVREKPAKWADFFAAVQKEAGCKVALPIWRFEIPAAAMALSGSGAKAPAN